MNKAIVFLIRVYQWLISPLLGDRCRFYPSCSQYTIECFDKFNFFQALWYSSIRILKCHPFHEGGYDPIPSEL
ncbi:MAG: membrane protein insertion efficiency factor YidD [Bacteriovoracaceae bacterium]|nr:membrane protein insertion efficiency factor YidD [Bacteriovoracaceae bacterium]